MKSFDASKLNVTKILNFYSEQTRKELLDPSANKEALQAELVQQKKLINEMINYLKKQQVKVSMPLDLNNLNLNQILLLNLLDASHAPDNIMPVIMNIATTIYQKKDAPSGLFKSIERDVNQAMHLIQNQSDKSNYFVGGAKMMAGASIFLLGFALSVIAICIAAISLGLLFPIVAPGLMILRKGTEIMADGYNEIANTNSANNIKNNYDSDKISSSADVISQYKDKINTLRADNVEKQNNQIENKDSQKTKDPDEGLSSFSPT